MLAAMHSSDDRHVRALLDQRAQRADVPATRFSTASDRSDSPSLYSHYPRSPAIMSPYTDHTDYHDHNDHSQPPYTLSPAQRLNDPSASSLDLSDDRSIISETSGINPAHEDDDVTVDVDSECTSIDGDEDDQATRLSLMGPKMRVHSRAPWEVDGDVSSSDEDTADNHSIFGGKGKNSKFGVMRGLGLGGARSPVPRKSFDSVSTSRGKRSFETSSGSSITTGGAIRALAKASMSSSSLALPISPPAVPRMSNTLDVPRTSMARNRTLSTASTANSIIIPPVNSSPRSPTLSHYSPSPRSPARSSSNETGSDQSYSRQRKGSFVHPFANPAHLKPYDRSSYIDPFSQELEAQDPEPSETHLTSKKSVTTLTSDDTVVFSQSSASNSLCTSSTTDLDSSSSATSQFTNTSSDMKTGEVEMARNNRLRRETKLGPIGNPTSFVHANLPSSPSPYNLISLEQAQAQFKERNRSATEGNTATFPTPHFHHTSTVGGDNAVDGRGRLRTASGPSQMKYAISHVKVDMKPVDSGPHSPISNSSMQSSPIGPPTKVLKQKRSGFLKLFNNKDKQVDDPPPPLPTFSDTRALARSPEPILPSSGRYALHRVPVPAMTVPSVESKMRRTGQPALSIKVTSPPSNSIRIQAGSSRSTESPQSLQVADRKAASNKPPASAPPGTSNFTTLSVRPVSSFFESTIAEHLLPESATGVGSSSTGDMSSLASPTSYSSDGISPSSATSFGAFSQTDNSRTSEESSAAIIATLKDQIRSSRKVWQQQIWELEGQIKDLKEEIDDMKSGDKCETCGRAVSKQTKKDISGGILHRPRAKTGSGARFASGNDC